MELIKLFPNLWQIQNTVNAECRKHLLMTMQHLVKGTRWAIQMVDSSTKLPAGLMEGNTFDLGNYNECIDIRVQEDEDSFQGQHCLARSNLNFLGKKQITWSMCIPSSCSSYDLSNLFSTVVNNSVDVNPHTCHIQETRKLTSEDYLAISVLSIFAFLCVVSTAYDIRVKDTGKKKDILRAFSWYSNCKELLNNASGSRETIKCLHGLRFLSIVWIMLGYSYMMEGSLPITNMNTYREKLTQWDRFLFGISIFSVETFLLISGLLVGHTFFKTDKCKKYKFSYSCIIRYLRLTPVLAISSVIYSGLIMHMGSGPLWDEQMQQYPYVCRKNWWATLLYIQNYMHKHEMCVREAWYLAVDAQLYILSPLLFITLMKRPRFGPVIFKVVIITSILSSFLQLYINGVTYGFQVESRYESADFFYTHTRATSWLIGLSLGLFLHKTESWSNSNTITLSKRDVFIGWLLGSMCLVLPVLWGHRFSQTNFLPSSLEFSIYFSLTKPLWCLGLSWLIFACTTGYGGPVNSILSWKVLQPLSKLTYCIYLIYFPFLLVKNNSIRTADYFSDYKQIHSTLGTLVYIILLALPTYLTFQAPVIALSKTTSEDSNEESTKQYTA